MIDLYTAVYLEINIISMIIPLLILFRSRRENNRQATNLAYNRVAVMTLLFVIIDTVWILIDGVPGAAFGFSNYLLNSLYLFISGYICYLWFEYVLCKLRGSSSRINVCAVLRCLPLAVLLVMCVATPFTGWLYEISPDNVYMRGPFVAVHQIICYVYMLATCGYSLRYAARKTSPERKSEALTLCSFLILPIAGGIISAFIYGLPMLCPCVSLSLMMVYLNLQSMQISTDELTGLNNRRQFDRYLLAQTESPHRDRHMFLLMLDVDDFKKINDTWGHSAGDTALVRTAGILKKTCGEWNCFLARYGGDEFAIIIECTEYAGLDRFREELNAAFERFNLSGEEQWSLTVSVGYSELIQDCDTPAALFSRADSDLYQAKSSAKRNR